MSTRKVWLACYDVRDPARLRAVHHIVRGYGDRVQYSVFRCVLSPLQVARLKARLVDVIAPTEDQVLFLPLGGVESSRAWAAESIGVPVAPLDEVVRIL